MQQQAADVYAPARPPHDFTTLDSLSYTDEQQSRAVTLRVHWPAEEGPHPLVVFSHGSVCSVTAYDSLTSVWAAHGYAVIAPLHLDGLESPQGDGPPDLGKLLASRIRDMSFVLDALPMIETAAGGGASIDMHRIAAAGHSFGALTALIKLGLRLADGAADAAADERFRASMSLSGVGNLPPMTEDAFTHVRGPMLTSGGTLDEGNVGAGPVFPWEWRLTAYAEASGTDKYRLAVDHADHYFGGLLARHDRGGAPDPTGLAMLAGTTHAFLDAYLQDNQQARDWLNNTTDLTLGDKHAALEHK